MTEALFRADVKKLQNTIIELNRLRAVSNKLRSDKLELESKILQYMQKNEEIGLEVDGIKILAENKKRHGKLNKQERQRLAIEALEKFGITNAEAVLEELSTSTKGESVIVPNLKIQSKEN